MASKPNDATSVQLETRDRSRRIETRLVKLMNHLGYDPNTQSPVWENGVLRVPSVSVALIDILDAIPERWNGPVEVYHDRHHMMTLRVAPPH